MSSADDLLNIETAAQLFHASDGTAFADLRIDGHRETWPVRSKRFRNWLRQHYYEKTWAAPSPAALNAALNVLEAQAQFDGPLRKVSVRVAEEDGLLYLDLVDEFWRCIEVSPDGWRIAQDPPVRFRRSAGMQPLPLPVRGGSIESLAPFLNLAGENDFVLVVAWLLGALRAGGPYPVLAIAGEQGSAKAVLSKLLRAVIDPSVAPVRALPRDERELFIAASNGHVLAFDNVSGLPPWLSDTLCRLASGSAFSTRRLFTDQDEILFAAARPVILNGIEDIITRPDLADRAILLTLGAIAEWQRPMRCGESLRLHDRTSLARSSMRPRMGYACCRMSASSGCRAWLTSRFGPQPARAHFEPRAHSKPLIRTTGALRSRTSSMLIAARVCEIMADRVQWTGSASDLLRIGINGSADKIARPGWPKNPRALAGRLRRAQTFLRSLNIEIAFGREGRSGTRTISMTNMGATMPKTASALSAASAKTNFTRELLLCLE